MTLTELKGILDTTNYPVAYEFFPADNIPAFPFIVFYVVRETANIGDNTVTGTKKEVSVELYTKHKDEVAEAVIQNTLNDFVWRKEETYLFDEQCFLITYEIEVV